MKNLHPIWYALIPDLAQAEKAIEALDKKIKELSSEEDEKVIEGFKKHFWQEYQARP